MAKRTILVVLLALASFPAVAHAQELGSQKVPWRSLALSIAVHGAGSGFDAYTSWQRVERNRFLASGAGGRFTAESAYKKAGWFAGVSLVEVLVVKKWGAKHPWIVRACRIGNLGSGGMMFSAGIHNLSNR
jgi:hypothetical protein